MIENVYQPVLYGTKPDFVAEFPGLNGPYDEGYQAAKRDLPCETNPYPFEENHWASSGWLMGWMAAVTEGIDE